jgi:hypothetical protein
LAKVESISRVYLFVYREVERIEKEVGTLEVG